MIGILTVTLMGTLISGLDRGFDKSMDFLGKDVLSISRWEWFGGQEWWEVRNRPRIKLEYVDKIKSKSKYAEAVATASAYFDFDLILSTYSSLILGLLRTSHHS